jgi:cell division protein FtsN
VKLGFHEQGTAQVSVEVVEMNEPAEQSYFIAVGTFLDQAQARRIMQRFLVPLSLTARITQNRQMLYRLELGPVSAGAELERLQALLTTMDLGEITILAVQ